MHDINLQIPWYTLTRYLALFVLPFPIIPFMSSLHYSAAEASCFSVVIIPKVVSIIVSIWRQFDGLNLSGFYLLRVPHSNSSISKPYMVLNTFQVFFHHMLYFKSKLKTNVECCVQRYHSSPVPTTLKVEVLFVSGFVFIWKVSVIAALVARSKGLLIQVHY